MLTYRDLFDLLKKNPAKLDEHVSIYDPSEDECYPLENVFFSNDDSPTAGVLDTGHLVLVVQKE